MNWSRFIQLACIAAVVTGCGDVMTTHQPPDTWLAAKPVTDGLALEAPLPTAAGMFPRRLFISGHSLVDQPYPDQLAWLAERAGTPFRWDRQYMVGSSIRQRSPPRMPEGPYDALLITEQHGLLGSLMWNQTEQHLREWHDALLAENPRAVTYLYVPWLSIDDKSDPQRWMAYEKAAAQVWQCAATRVNSRIASEGRLDRIVTIPASLALVFLIERLQIAASLPGITGTTARESIDRIVADDVHLTPLGSFYMALVSYLSLTGVDPASLEPLLASPISPEVTPEQAHALLDVAARFMAARRERRVLALDPEACRRFLSDTFIDDYWEYTRRVSLQPDRGWLRSQWSAFRSRRQSRAFFGNW